MPKKKNKLTPPQTDAGRDELLDMLATQLNKSNKDGGKVAYFLDEADSPSDVTDWIGTGSSMLDLAISNRPHGGLPVGRMVEFNGLESSGKSLLSAQIMANTQKKGGVAVYIDTENAASPEFWESLGVDIKQMLYLQVDSVEAIFEKMEEIITVVRKSDKDRILTVIVDSVAAASCTTELESEHGKDGYNTTKAIVIGKAMRKITNMIGKQKVLTIFTNQLRQNMNAMAFGDKYVVPGGKSIPYHCSVRVRLNNTGKLKQGDRIVGNGCKAVVQKNRMGPPHRSAEFDIYYDSGIADYASWIKVMKNSKLLKQAGAYYKYTKDDGEEIQFQTKNFIDIMNDTSLRDEIYKKICDVSIMEYNNPNSKIEDSLELATDDGAGIDEENN
jgi:recombination protein RecA